jgi:Icc-related predicted phosphoesterase
MKLLVIVDIHKSEKALRTTKSFIDKYSPDVLLIAGDITTFGPIEFAQEFLGGLPDIRTLAIPGNCDPREVLRIIDESNAVNLHGKKELINGIPFIGLGGSNSTPFNTPFELTEDEIFDALDPIMEPGAIMMTHFPVKGHLDEVPRGENTGSSATARIVAKYSPSLVISGHIHETRGTKTDENGVVYVNPGPLQNGYAALIELELEPRIEEDGSNKKYKCQIQLIKAED